MVIARRFCHRPPMIALLTVDALYNNGFYLDRIMPRFLFAILFFTAHIACAQSQESLPPPVTETVPLIAAALPTPSIDASSYLLVDVASDQVLLAYRADEPREPASLTKLMTAYLTFSALRDKSIQIDQKLKISENAKRTIGSRMFADPRVPVSVDELLRGMIIQSGNDASIALAELVAGDETAFAAMMNTQAQKLGMSKTHFVNSTGLPDPQHYSTAADMARLAIALINDFPEFYPLYSEKEYTYNKITQHNRNRLLKTDPYVDGVKTGYTDSAGWCLIASAKRGERRLLSVALGAASDAARAVENQKLLNWGYQAFDVVQLYAVDQPVSQIHVWKGSAPEVNVGFLKARYLSVPKGQSDKLKLTMVAQTPLTAPVQKGQNVGKIQVRFDDKLVIELPLIAQNDVAPGSFFRRSWDTIRLWFQ
ncbi:MAG: D-alanyl-D-alanine carboxypeptidase [Burkholderiales bacterium]|jgi:D-alanyl-D-alanine carboxypeptidase (penicillin-binding protein 5/6)|nr:D-alanyl-D-alanine carboxypeptidase [Burkholderiales bacterium]